MGKFTKKYRFIAIVFIFVALSLLIGCENQKTNGGTSLDNERTKVETVDNDTASLEEMDIEKTVGEMSLDEKIGQMLFAGIPGTTLTENSIKLINQYDVGGIIFFRDNLQFPPQSIELINKIKTINSENRIPLFLGVDQEGGIITRLPGNITGIPTNAELGAKNDPELSYEIGTVLGKEVKAFGFNVDFAPVLDVNSNPDNPVIGNRSFGDNPDIVSELGVQTMKGIQSENVISVIKHFPGHGDTSVDSHLGLPEVDKGMEDLEELELVPFKYAIENGADMVMTAHILLPKIDPIYPATMSGEIINGILREQLGFNGVVITDDMTMGAIVENYDIGEAAVNAVKAGVDIVMIAHEYDNVISAYNALKKAVENGEITEERINESVTRIIQLKQKYELNRQKIDSVNVQELDELVKDALYGTRGQDN